MNIYLGVRRRKNPTGIASAAQPERRCDAIGLVRTVSPLPSHHGLSTEYVDTKARPKIRTADYSPDDDCVLAPKVIRYKRDAGHALIASWLQLYRKGPRAKEIKPDSPPRIWRARQPLQWHQNTEERRAGKEGASQCKTKLLTYH